MATANDVERARRDGVLLGIPLGDLGWFQSLLMGLATGFAAFFASTFVAIFVMLFYRIASGHNPDFALSYRVVGFPVGVVVMAMALSYLGFQWVRRMKRRAQRRSERAA
jgi:ABC-type dipeptide/oligopeptide/nickel transport system permease subunit